MKKTVSLIIATFLLLSSCGKISKLINPSSGTSAKAAEAQAAIEKAATEAKAAKEPEITAQTVEPAGTQAPKEPEIKTPSESEKKSEETKEITAQSETESKETKEKQEAENKEEPPEQKPATNSWFTKEKIAIATGTAVGAYAVYKFMDWVINADYEIPHREVDDDEYSTETRTVYTRRNSGLDFTIYNENLRFTGHQGLQCENTILPETPTRLVSKTGKIVKRNHEAQYKANWEAYKRENYPGLYV